ncbi:MAG: 3-deoxy-D-manno-octulosonic acid transferase [Rudanella sp.]|nr:3-deoxy-D-manno-octulosonic acid transferase [Rudanella sp.]
MVSLLYNTSIRAYSGLLRLVAPFNPKARQWVAGRQNWQPKLRAKLADNTAPVAWFHAASLGEFEQGRPVMEAFRTQYPAYKILLTFFSPSGYEVRKNYAGADFVSYLPADTPENARAFVALAKPKIVFFVKYEFWANYLHELRAAQIPILSFSAIFRPNQLFFKPWGSFYRKLLTCFSHILVQNQESEQLLRGLGLTEVTLAGDTRFDRVAQVAVAKKGIPIVTDFKTNGGQEPQPLLVIGSAWQADMDVLIPFLNSFEQPLKVIIAPHEIHDDEIERWRSQLTKASVRYSKMNERRPGWRSGDLAKTGVAFQPLNTTQYLFIDNIGILSSLYQYGEFAYIGGAFGKGLHNILEAATFGVPIFFGPNYGKFQEAVDLIEEGGAFAVQDTHSLTEAFQKQYADHTNAAQISRDYVQRNIGATAQVMEVVKKTL